MKLPFSLYGALPEYEILESLCEENAASGLPALLSLAAKYGLSGNLWQSFLSYLLAFDENPFSLALEMRSEADGGSFAAFAKQDLSHFYHLFWSPIPLENDLLSDFSLPDFSPHTTYFEAGNMCNLLAKALCSTTGEADFFDCVAHFYQTYGVGKIGLFRAFRLNEKSGQKLSPAAELSSVRLSDLWGYDLQKALLTDNTASFLEGKGGNNVLLYGDSGTGKSTSVKAILNEHYEKGLRMIEIFKGEFSQLPTLIESLRARNYKFIIYMDDLSFEEFEIEYKYLKAIIEGGLSPKPENVLIYATSNRRHLIRETWKDRRETDENLHPGDTVQEKLSLSDRFGLSINFSTPRQAEYFDMVRYLANKNHLALDDEELIRRARIWSLEHAKMSGRVAQQFINHLLGEA